MCATEAEVDGIAGGLAVRICLGEPERDAGWVRVLLPKTRLKVQKSNQQSGRAAMNWDDVDRQGCSRCACWTWCQSAQAMRVARPTFCADLSVTLRDTGSRRRHNLDSTSRQEGRTTAGARSFRGQDKRTAPADRWGSTKEVVNTPVWESRAMTDAGGRGKCQWFPGMIIPFTWVDR